LRQGWSRRSLRSIWPGSPAQWQCAAVDDLCAGLLAPKAEAGDLVGAARRLGEQRSTVRTHLHEARGDLEIALGLAQVGRRRRLELLDALTIGWAEQGVERLSALPVVDPAAEMPTLAYLRLRLHELYREASLSGAVLTDHCLLVVAETEYSPQRLVAEARLTSLSSALQYAFVGGESIAAVTDRRAVALVARDEPRLTESLARLRSELNIALLEGRLPAVRCWRQLLPPTPDDLSLALLGALG
jgi:hypothetical protein